MNPNVQTAQNALTSFQGGQQSSNDILNAAMTQYGVQGAQTTANNLQGTINNTTAALNALPAQVQGNTSRSLVTQAQLGGITNEEAAPIQQALASQQASYGTASDNYKTLLGEAQDTASSNETDQQNKEAELEQNYQDAVNQAAAQQAAQQTAAQQAEQVRMDNATISNNQASLAQSAAATAAANNPAAGYKVAENKSGGLAFTGPNGATSMYQYAAALNNGDPNGTYNTIKQLLSQSGDPSDKGALAGMTRLEQQGLSQAQILQRLKASNPAIF